MRKLILEERAQASLSDPFMYPQAEAAGVRRDSLDPERFRDTITARET